MQASLYPKHLLHGQQPWQLSLSSPMFHPYVLSLAGGLLIGLASWMLLASLGRVAGISGIAAATLLPQRQDRDHRWTWAFMLGLIAVGTLAAHWLQVPMMHARPWPLLLAAGLLVGFGTVLGSGCTSGHGVCGLGRRSLRSLVATLVFMGTGMVTVAAVKLIVGAN